MILKFINSIQLVPSQFLKSMVRVAADKVSINLDELPLTNVPFKKPAQLTISDKADDGNRLYTAKLTFATVLEWLPKFNRVGVVCTAIDGTQYIIGNDRQPFPVCTQQQNHPDTYKESELTEVNVSWSTPLMPPTRHNPQ